MLVFAQYIIIFRYPKKYTPFVKVIKTIAFHISLYECIQFTRYLQEYNPLQESGETHLYDINQKRLKNAPLLGPKFCLTLLAATRNTDKLFSAVCERTNVQSESYKPRSLLG